MLSVSKNILTILPYLWNCQSNKNRCLILITFFLIALTILCNLSIPFIFKEIVNVLSAQQKNNFRLALILLAAYGACWLVGKLLEKIREMLFFRPMSTAITEYSIEVFNHIHSQSLKFHLDRETGRVSGAIQKSQLAMAMVVTNLLFRISPVFIEILLAFFILWNVVGIKISIVLMLTLLVYLVMNYFVVNIFKRAEQNYVDLDIIVDKRIIDSFLNSENIKFLNAEKFESHTADNLLRNRENAIIKVFWTGTLATTLQAIVLGTSLTIISFFIGQDVLSGTLEVGDFVLVNGYLILLFNPVEAITGFIRNTISYSGDLSHSTALLQEEHAIEDVANASDININHAEIIFTDVDFSYDDKHKNILKRFTLKIPAQSTVAIVGASGSGKSTISRLIFRFYDVNHGAITIDGQNIKLVKKASLRNNIAFVPQDIVLLNTSLKANITYGNANVSDAKINAIVQAVHLDKLVQKLSQGLATIVGERGVKLSGGEKQRIAIARALLKSPKIIVFDEATSSLDTATEKEIQNNIFEVTTNITTILIAHRLSTIVHADKIVVLEHGKIVEQGTHSELMALNKHYAKLWKERHAQL